MELSRVLLILLRMLSCSLGLRQVQTSTLGVLKRVHLSVEAATLMSLLNRHQGFVGHFLICANGGF